MPLNSGLIVFLRLTQLSIRTGTSIRQNCYANYLKLTRPTLRPAFHHHLGLGEKLDRVLSLTVEGSKEALFPPAEGEECHWSCYTHVDADISGLGLIAELPRCGTVAGK